MRGVERGETTDDYPSDRDIALLNWGQTDGVDL